MYAGVGGPTWLSHCEKMAPYHARMTILSFHLFFAVVRYEPSSRFIKRHSRIPEILLLQKQINNEKHWRCFVKSQNCFLQIGIGLDFSVFEILLLGNHLASRFLSSRGKGRSGSLAPRRVCFRLPFGSHLVPRSRCLPTCPGARAAWGRASFALFCL